MARKTALDKLNENIAKILADYAEDVKGNLGEIVSEMGKKGVQAIRQKTRETFPVKKGRKITGEYAKGWKVKDFRERLATRAVIYNDHYSLVHLLENGHVTRNGTDRVFKDTPAHPHVAPVAEELTETFQREVVEKL